MLSPPPGNAPTVVTGSRKRKPSRAARDAMDSGSPASKRGPHRRRTNVNPTPSPEATVASDFVSELEMEMGVLRGGIFDETDQGNLVDFVDSVDPVVPLEYRPGQFAQIISAMEMKDSSKAELTWLKYCQIWRRFHKWSSKNGHGRFLIEGKNLQVRKELFASIRLPIPINIFEAYLTWLVHKKTNELKDYSVPSAFWASLVYAHDVSVPQIYVPETLRHNWKQYSAGYQRVQPRQVIDMGLTVYEGKDSLTRKGFLNLQRLTLQGSCTKSQMLWVPQMNAGTRNLVARVNSIGQLITSTIRWKNDCLCITLPRHKSDQTGERTIERHIHANATDPLACFIFWLGIRILCEPTAGKSHYVFGDNIALYHRDGRRGPNQRDEAFGEWMGKAMSMCGGRKRTVEEQLELFDCLAKYLGTHSNRKGSLEELTTSPDGPPPVAALLRSGHSIGGVVERYILQMHGGDEFCSRICAGMDLQSKSFAMLPPHFNRRFLEGVDFSDFVWNYNTYDTCFKTTVPFLVAAVVYQWSTGWIKENFPPNHPLFESPIVLQGHMARLAQPQHISVPNLQCSCCGMRATGIPQAVKIAMDIDNLASTQEDLKNDLRSLLGTNGHRSLSRTICEEVDAALGRLGDRFVDIMMSNSSKLEEVFSESTTKMENRLATAIERVGVGQELTVNGLSKSTASTASTVLPVPSVPSTPSIMVGTLAHNVVDIAVAPEAEYDYVGDDKAENDGLLNRYCVHSWARPGEQERLHPIPLQPHTGAYQFPSKVAVGIMFERWHMADEVNGLPPLKCLRSWDVVKGLESYYHKAKSVCNAVVFHARANGCIPPKKRVSDLSFEQRSRLCTVGVDAILMAHNDYNLAKLRSKREEHKFVPFRPRNSVNMSYVTMHKYLHNAKWKEMEKRK